MARRESIEGDRIMVCPKSARTRALSWLVRAGAALCALALTLAPGLAGAQSAPQHGSLPGAGPARPAGVTPIKLNGEMPDYADVRAYGISPNGQYVVYVDNGRNYSVGELYSVPVTGGAPHAGISTYTFTPDGRPVVYTADQEVTGKTELYVAVDPYWSLTQQLWLPLTLKQEQPLPESGAISGCVLCRGRQRIPNE
jgi:hypothetical protein